LNPQKQRSLFEAAFVLMTTLMFSLFISVLGASALKFQIAFGIGLFGLIAICLIPARRTLCLCLWVLIQPLSIEKILYAAAPIWQDLRGQEIVMNAADAILIILAVILIFEKIILNKAVFVWDKKAKLFFALFAWGVCSYCVHLGFYHSEFVNTAPLGILHLFRNLIFVIIIGSAIQTRKDLVWILITVAVIIIIESILVGLSYATGEAFNFSRLLGLPPLMQKYSADGEVISRATGTLGVPNQQAMFHAVMTFLLLGLFSAKKAFFRHIALIGFLASFTAVIFTFSRSSWLSIGVATILIVAIFIKRQEVTPKAWLMGSMIAILFIGVLAVVAQPIINRLTKGDDGATDSRIRMISLATDLAIQYPIIGVGPYGFAEAGLVLYPPGQKETEWVPVGGKAIVPPLGRIELATSIVPGQKPLIVPLPVHNKYLLMLSELGIVGLILWLMIFWTFFMEAKICSRSSDALLRYTGVAGMAIVLVALIYMMLDLFADDKTLQVVLFPLVVVSSAYRLSKNLKPSSV
jgi:putative inorganic carbon (HCO3(-)) transporter